MDREKQGFQWLPLLFLGSGCAALIYEILWLQMLEFVIGSTAVSLAVLLGTFMGGLCLGSLFASRVLGVSVHPLRAYAALEGLTGLCGLLVPIAIPWIQHIYVAAAGTSGDLVLRAVAGAVVLLPPTVLMGATLPVVSRWVTADEDAPRKWGYLYGANIAGGVVGCLAAGFWLLRVYDMHVATGVAVALNALVALAAMVLARGSFEPAPVADYRVQWQTDWRVLVGIGLSGLSALGAEVVWTRLLALTVGPTVYAFSIILAVFLIGLSLGSGAGSMLVRRSARVRSMFAASQALLIPAILWGSYLIATQLPYWEKDLTIQADPFAGFLFDLACCGAALLPATLLWGASFPLALAAASTGGGESARVIGFVYAANTVGAIAGSVLFSVAVVPAVGSQNAGRILLFVACLAVLALLPAGFRRWQGWTVLGTTVLAVWLIPAIPWKLIAFGRRMPVEIGPWKELYSTEGRNSSIAYTEWVDKQRFFHVAGKVEASNSPFDMRLERMLGHIPAILHPNPRSVLIVGCGAGVTAGAFVVHPEVERITLCEIEPRIPPATARFFGKENHDVIRDRRTRIVFDDARHYVLTTRDKFDVITSDPIHPWVKGAASLYSKEYFEMVRAHLNPGGLVTQWVPLYESDFATVKSEIATFFEVFPDAVIFGNMDLFDQGYDLVMLGSASVIRPDLDEVDRRLRSSVDLAASLKEVGFRTAADLLGMYASQPLLLRDWLRDAQINRDRNLRLQFLAGMSLNRSVAGSIYGEIERHSPFPENFFRGTPERLAELRKVFDSWRTMQY